MNSLLLHCLVLLSGLPGSDSAGTTDSIPMYSSPVVHPELQPGVLVLSPVFDTTTTSIAPKAVAIDTFVQHLLSIQGQQQERLRIYYEQEHLRLDGMLKAKNTDRKVQIDSYTSKAERNGENNTGLLWQIFGYTRPRSTSEQARHLRSVFAGALAALQWYSDVHQRTIDWPGVTFQLEANTALNEMIAKDPLAPYTVELSDKEGTNGPTFVLTIKGPSFFQQAYHDYLNEAAKVERETRRRIRQH